MTRVLNGFQALVFAAAVGAPLWLRVASGRADGSARAEMREPAPAPGAPRSLEELAEWPAACERWWADGFNLRGTLVRWRNAGLLLGLGVSPTPDMQLGGDGWLFYTGQRAFDAWQGADPFEPEELAAWVETLEGRRTWLAERGARFLFAIVPEKQSVYPELVPAGWVKAAGPTRADQLAAALAERGTIEFVDLGPSLAAARATGLAYFPHGTHWNEWGAWHAYTAIAERAAAWVPGFAPWPLSDFELADARAARSPDWNGDTWAERMLIPDLLRQEVLVLQPRRERRARIVEHHDAHAGVVDGTLVVDDPALPRVLLFRDSFGDLLWPFLAEHSSALRVEADRILDRSLIEDFDPDLVLCVIVERHLHWPLPGI